MLDLFLSFLIILYIDIQSGYISLETHQRLIGVHFPHIRSKNF